MKKLFLAATLLLAFGTLVQSCKKEDTTPEDTGNGNDTSDIFKLTDNGTNFTALGLVKQYSNNIITAGAPIDFTSGYALAIADTLNPGVYALGPIAPVQVSKTESSGNIVYTQQSGTLVITAHNKTAKTISGTFSGTLIRSGGSETRTITNGEFDFDY